MLLVVALPLTTGLASPPAIFTPLAPTSADVIRARFAVPGGCGTRISTSVTGTTLRTVVGLFGCVTGPPPISVTDSADFGPLAANTYTYEVAWDDEEDSAPPTVVSRQTLVVVSAPATAWTPATFAPASPSNSDTIRATFTIPGGCGTESSTTRSGTVVRTTVLMFGCGFGPPPFTVDETVFFGPLPSGNYTYEIYFDPEFDLPQLRSTQPLVVGAAATIPTLSTLAMTALLLALALVAFVGVGKQAG